MKRKQDSLIFCLKALAMAVVLLFVAMPLQAKERYYSLESPDGRLKANIEPNGQNTISFDLYYDGKSLMLMTTLNLTCEMGGKAVEKMTVQKATRRVIDETIASPFTRQAMMRDHCNELSLQCKEGLSVVFRAYNEGFAYRYVWEGKPGKVIAETSSFFFDKETVTVPYVTNYDSTLFPPQPFILSGSRLPYSPQWSLFNPQYSSSFENQYTTLPIRKLDERRLCFLPVLVHCRDGIKMCITESSLTDYPGMYLRHFADGVLESRHATLPKRVEQGGHNNLQLLVKEREGYIAEMDKEKHFPWRIMMVAENSTSLAMNNMSYLLGEPSRVEAR